MKNRFAFALLAFWCLAAIVPQHRAKATVSATTNRVTYTGNGVTTAFAFPYYFQKNADLKVWTYAPATGAQTLQVLTTNYTVAGAALANGGTVTMLVAPPTGMTLVIYDDPDQTQNLSMSDSGPFSAKQIELRLDKAILVIQRLSNQISRSIHLPEGDASGFNPTMPTTITANAVFAADPTGKFIVMGAQQASAAQTAQLIGGGDADPLHFHGSDRNRANHTGTQLSTTISDFVAAVLAQATPTAIGAVPTTRQVIAGTGISGGGTLAADRTFNLADTVVTPAAYGSAILIPTFTVDQQGRLTAASTVAPQFTATQLAPAAGITATQISPTAGITNTQIDGNAAIKGTQLAAGAAILGTQLSASANIQYTQLQTRQVIAGIGLVGGGDLSADRTFDMSTTGVAANSYGSNTSVGTFVVNAYGRLTAAANVAISGLADSALTNGANYLKKDGSVVRTANQDYGGFQSINHLVENIAAGAIPAASNANRGRLLFDVTANEFVYSNGTQFIRASENPSAAHEIPIAQNSPTVNFVMTYNGSGAVWAAAGAGSTIAIQSNGSLVTGSPASTINANGGLQAGNVSGGVSAISVAAGGITLAMINAAVQSPAQGTEGTRQIDTAVAAALGTAAAAGASVKASASDHVHAAPSVSENTNARGATTLARFNGSGLSSSTAAGTTNVTVSNPFTYVSGGYVTRSGNNLLFAPDKSNRVMCYENGAWIDEAIPDGGLTVACTSLNATATYTLYFVGNSYSGSGGLAPTLDLATGNNTVTQNGIPVKGGATNETAIAICATDGSGAIRTFNEFANWQNVCNLYNKRRICLYKAENSQTASYTYTTAAWRAAHADLNNACFCTCDGNNHITARVAVRSNSSGGNSHATGIGIDSTTVDSAVIKTSCSNSVNAPSSSVYIGSPSVGKHIVTWLEYSVASNTTTWVTYTSIFESAGITLEGSF